MRLIDADKLRLSYCNPSGTSTVSTSGQYYFYSQAEVNNAPTVDAEPLRRGHWFDEEVEEAGAIYTYTRCSACGEYALCDAVGQIIETPYCPWCGAWLTKEVK